MEELRTAWELLRVTYATGILIAGVLGAVGVWVVARDQIFLGAAVSQASTLGVAVALALSMGDAGHEGWVESGGMLSVLAVLAAVATALLAAGAGVGRRISAEAVTGWVFLVSSSVPVLLVAHEPHGLEIVRRLTFSTLLSAGIFDLRAFALLALLVGAVVAWGADRLTLVALDPETAAAFGLRQRAWSAGVAIVLGASVGLAIRSSGAVFTFGCLVLPGLVAQSVCRETRQVLWVAPAVAAGSAAVAFAAAHPLDWPPAHAAVALQGLLVAACWLPRALRR